MTRILDWLEHRAGVRTLVSLMLLEGVPGGARWRYVFGSCLAFVFSIQLVTGIMLMTAYSPSSSQAWNSVHFIQYKMDFGWLIRGLHHFGSQTMMVLIALHMLQVVLAGAHLPPRELNWWTGIGLLSMTLGLSLTGYLLPWDQKGYWATDVATNIAGTLPQMGADVKQQAVGGPDSGNHTLTRFYALHVAILPGSLILLLIAHIAIFRKQGVTNSANVEGLANRPENEHAEGTETFWPRQAFYDLVACLLVFSVMLGLVLYGFAHKVEWPERADGSEPSFYEKMARAGMDGKGAELDAAADRDTAGYPARPEWYFLFLFQLLKYFPGDYSIYGTVVIPNGVMFVLTLLPLFGIGPLRKFGHFFGILFVVLLFVMIGLLTLKALDDDKPEGILWGIMKNKDDAEAIKVAEGFQHKVHAAEILAQRACQLAMPGTPVEGGHLLIRNDPYTTGQKLFQQKCGSCHNFTAREGDKFESWTHGEKAGDLGDFGSETWVRSLLTHPMDKKHFGLVMRPELDDKGMEMMDEKGNVQLIAGLTGMKRWRENIDKARKKGTVDAKGQDAEFDLIAKWLADQSKPRDKRNLKLAQDGQEAFMKPANKCSSCHGVEIFVKGEAGKKDAWENHAGDTDVPDLSGYGSADWIRAMIMRPGHESLYGSKNLMHAFRPLEGPGAEIGLKELRETNKGISENMIRELPEVDRELIIRWMLRDYRPVFGGSTIR